MLSGNPCASLRRSPGCCGRGRRSLACHAQVDGTIEARKYADACKCQEAESQSLFADGTCRPVLSGMLRWHRAIGDSTYADAILDRIVHAAYRVELQGDSLRKPGRGVTAPSGSAIDQPASHPRGNNPKVNSR